MELNRVMAWDGFVLFPTGVYVICISWTSVGLQPLVFGVASHVWCPPLLFGNAKHFFGKINIAVRICIEWRHGSERQLDLASRVMLYPAGHKDSLYVIYVYLWPSCQKFQISSHVEVYGGNRGKPGESSVVKKQQMKQHLKCYPESSMRCRFKLIISCKSSGDT